MVGTAGQRLGSLQYRLEKPVDGVRSKAGDKHSVVMKGMKVSFSVMRGSGNPLPENPLKFSSVGMGSYVTVSAVLQPSRLLAS